MGTPLSRIQDPAYMTVRMNPPFQLPFVFGEVRQPGGLK